MSTTAPTTPKLKPVPLARYNPYSHQGECTPTTGRSCRLCYRYFCPTCNLGVNGMFGACYECEETDAAFVSSHVMANDATSYAKSYA